MSELQMNDEVKEVTIMGKEILCPYCCKRFKPTEVHFRLKHPIKKKSETNNAEVDKTNLLQQMWSGSASESMGITNEEAIEKNNDGKERDEKLYQYLLSVKDEASAARESLNYGYVEYDVRPGSKLKIEGKYLQEQKKYGYNLTVMYEGQELDERLCPHCHNTLVPDAGKYDMYMFSLIGHTNVGKTVYLTVLTEMMQRDGYLNANMTFVGTQAEKNYYMNNRRQLIGGGQLVEATKDRVPHLTFKITYDDIKSRSRKSILVVFCDIMGEACRDLTKLQTQANHLKASNGLLFLLDPTRFKQVGNILQKNNEEYDNMQQVDVYETIATYLTAAQHEDKTSIPTAVLMPKSDTLANMPYFAAHKGIVDDVDYDKKHQGYVNDDEIMRMNKGIIEFLKDIGEGQYVIKMQDLFEKYSFFINSALGFNVEKDNMQEEEVVSALQNNNFNPYRVTEAFYWLLSQNDVLPKKLTYVYRNSKSGEENAISKYYYSSEENSVGAEIEKQREESLPNNLVHTLLKGKWELVPSKTSRA